MKESNKLQFKFPLLQKNTSAKSFATQSLNVSFLSKYARKQKCTEEQRNRVNSILLQSSLKKNNIDDVELQLRQAKLDDELANNQNQDIVYHDRTPKLVVGTRAVNNYYKHYKKLTKILDQDNIASIAHSPYTAILQKSESLNAFPGCYGIIKPRGERNALHLENYKLGDKYTEVVSAGLKELKDFDEYVFSKNRLSNKGFHQLLNNINPDVAKLDFSNNQIRSIDQNLMKILIGKDSKLTHLNLENNKLGDMALQTLAFGIVSNKSLKYLNLNKNFLTKVSGQHISSIISKNKTLEELYLSWNKINGTGGKCIFETLQEDKNLRVLDYSHNALGMSQPSVNDSVVGFLKKNKTVLHLDLSFNNFNLQNSKDIAEALNHNRTIYGMHFSGNFGYVDSRGFIVFDDHKQVNTVQSVRNYKINGYQVNFKRPTNGLELLKDVCWVCEGWVEFTINKCVNQPANCAYFQFGFDGFKPRYTSVVDKAISYKTMVPPSLVKMFYTLNKIQGYFEDQFVEKVQLQQPLSFIIEGEELAVKETIICNRWQLESKKLINQYHEPDTSILPRTPDSKEKKKKNIKTWHYRQSCWAKQWRKQDQETTLKCFERDWAQSKIPNIIKNPIDQQKCKALLYKNYKGIKEIYKYFAAWSPFGDIWAVAANPFTQFCNQAKLVSKELPLKIIDLTFITTNSMSGVDWKGNHQVPQRGLTRFQFMEAIVRLADQKYRKSGLCETMFQSLSNIIKQNLQSQYPRFQSEAWRESVYFVKQNDYLIKKYRNVFANIYKRYSKKQVMPGEKAFMCLDQFREICQRAGMFAGSTVERDAFINFNISMMTQVDEIESQKIYKMTQIEFIEALARMANQLSLNNLGLANNESQRLNRPLFMKFQELIFVLIQNLCNQDIRSQFPQNETMFKEQKETDSEEEK